jgi:phospholipase C
MVNQFRLDDRRVVPATTRFTDDDRGDGFFARAKLGSLPPVTFIDPNFVDIPPRSTANDDLPPTDISKGQILVGKIYDALVNSPQWEKTLFVITYDEHGGFFDHVPPPGTTVSGLLAEPEVFPGVHHLGVRVPTFVVSPWVPAAVSSVKFDHTSILKTILLRFLRDRMPDLGPRVASAQHLGALLTNSIPRLDVPNVDAPEPSTRPPFIPGGGDDDFREAMSSFGQPRFVHSGAKSPK